MKGAAEEEGGVFVMPTGIEYLDEVWNPVTGCTAISAACANCWARRMTRRLEAMGMEKYANGFDTVVCHDREVCDDREKKRPLNYRSPKVIGVCFMADLFHDEVDVNFIQSVFDVMMETPQHSYVGLTKRAQALSGLADMLNWPENLWMGVTVESREYKWRIDDLSAVPCKTWVSFEPLLSSIGDLGHIDFDWAVVGCESGPGARPMETWWAEEVIRQCEEGGVKVFFKQAVVGGKLMSMPKLYGGVKHDYNAPWESLHETELLLPL